MRRTAPTGPLSPKLIKHFAVATVALTGLLAIFASGEDWGAQAQIGAVEETNQVLAAEAEQLGTRRLAAKLKVMPGPSRMGFDEDPGTDFGDRANDNAPQPAPQQPVPARGNRSAPPPGLASAPDATMTVNSAPPPAKDPLPNTAKIRAKSTPTAQQIADIAANSARRSGQAGEPD